jgi:hypothetical protein
MTLNEKKELILRLYEKTLDVNLAFRKLRISDIEQKQILDDSSFNDRLTYILTEVQEDIITTVRGLLGSDSEAIRLRAATKLGEILYSSRFIYGQKSDEQESENKPLIYLPDNGRDEIN